MFSLKFRTAAAHVALPLLQDYDESKENYGVVSAHPERIDLNYTLQSTADWTHIQQRGLPCGT